MKNNNVELPNDREPILRVTTQPNDANPKGDIFGGWLMSQIDIAGAIIAVQAAKGNVSTVAVNNLRFVNPLFAYDIVSFYGDLQRVGNSSVRVFVEVFAQKRLDMGGPVRKVGEAELVYVAVDGPGQKRLIPK